MASSCQQAEEWFEQALDGTLGARQQRELRKHLDGCPRCRRRFGHEQRAAEALRALREARDAARPAAAAASLASRVVAALPDLSPQVLGQVARVVGQAASDAALRHRLQLDPRGTLAALGVTLPPTLKVEAVAEWPAPPPTADTLYLPLPEAPLQVQALEERLAAMGLGSMFGVWW
jgi:hypothetical protein